MKPTKEQIKKFWEWCGFYQERVKEVYDIGYSTMWRNNKGYWHSALPPIDLNNLFKYAVPKLIELNYSFDIWNGSHQMISLIDEWGVQLSLPTRVFHTEIQETLALALFWAINKAIEEE